MSEPESSFRERLAAGEVVVGTWSVIPSSWVAEVLAIGAIDGGKAELFDPCREKARTEIFLARETLSMEVAPGGPTAWSGPSMTT